MRRPRFTPVPHELIDEHLLEMSGPEVKVLLVILRKSHGWNRETETISLSQLSKIAGISTSTCSDSVKALVDRGLVKKTTNSTTENGHCASTYEPCFEDDPPSRPSEEATRSSEDPSRPSEEATRSSEDPSRPSEEYKEERKEAEQRKETYSSPTPSQESPRATAKYAANGWNRFPGLPSFRGAVGRAAAEEDFASKHVDISESDYDASLVAYAAKYRAEDEKPKLPWKYFLAGIHDWASTAPTGQEFPSGYQAVPFLVDLKTQYDAIGANVIPADFDRAVKECKSLTAADMAKALARVPDFDPAYIRRPQNYLHDREFDRPPRPAPKSNLEKLMEMA